jgi:hypothetical protein
MKKFILVFILLPGLILIWGCPEPIHKKPYNYHARFPDNPVNLADVNSPYDDFNSILPEIHFGKALIFSSNRGSIQGEFDLIGEKFHATWFMETGELRVDNTNYWQNTYYVASLLHNVSNEGNEFGPYAFGFDGVIEHENARINILAYSTNNDSTAYHEEFVYHVSYDGGETGTVYGPFQIENLTNDEQQYISFYGPVFTTIDQWSLNPDLFTQMYFDVKQNNTSDIYKIDLPENLSFMDFLMDTTKRDRQKIEILSSDFNDRCPFINGKMMVFTSDRAGGYGGFDLYWSTIEDGKWSEPVNFGEQINTASDEFRPVIVQVNEFENDVMIFSSNRPGGQGGFDLYYVGIEKQNHDANPD